MGWNDTCWAYLLRIRFAYICTNVLTLRNLFAATRSTARLALSMRFPSILAALALFSSAVNSATVEATIDECWKGNDHRGMSECVSRRATSARDNLQAVERAMREYIARSQEDISYLAPVRQRFESSVSSYLKYRTEQCSLREALAMMGNGAVQIRLACEAELDLNRAQELRSGLWWLN